MAWKLAPHTFFLSAGEARQFEVHFGGNLVGPQFMQAVHDGFSSGSGGAQILVMQWNGIANEAVAGGAKRFYVCGVHNAGTVNASFHLEGGGVT
jgi:hypothetical protein